MKGVKKVISILVRIISITRMKLLMFPKAKKPDHFACKMGLHTSLIYKVTKLCTDEVGGVKMKENERNAFCNSKIVLSLLLLWLCISKMICKA